MALVGAPSRFSVLKTDVSDPLERKKPQAKTPPVNNNSNNSNSKKQQPNKKNVKNNNNNNSNNKKKKAQTSTAKEETAKFDEWKKRDEKLMDSTYEKELQEALLMSRLEQEKKVEQRPEATNSTDPVDAKKRGKVTLTLQEFHEKFVDEKPPSPPIKAEPLSKLLALRKEQEEEQKLRLTSEREASAIVAREKLQQEFIDKASQPKMVSQEEYDQMLEMKRKQIEHMAKVLNSTNKELAILQEQNADLEKLLAKGELKKKVELIREVEELRVVKDELTEQVQTLFAALEQEKSKTTHLTQELQKRR